MLRRSYKDHLFKVRKMWKKMFTLGSQCMFIALGVKRCRYWLLWLLWSMNLSDCLSLHWTLVGSLVLLVEAVHFSSARRAGGDHLFKVRKMWKKMFTLGFSRLHWLHLVAFGCFGAWFFLLKGGWAKSAVLKFETWCYGAPIRTISSKLGRCEKRCLHWVSSACS